MEYFVKGGKRMKKIKYVIFLGSLMIPTMTTFAAEEVVGQGERAPYSLESIGEEKAVEQKAVEQKGQTGEEIGNLEGRTQKENQDIVGTSEYITWEVIQNDLMIEDSLKRYEYLIKDEVDGLITYGKMAQLICTYIGRAPMSLPQTYGGSNGYIGRLVIEGIWGELLTDMNLRVEQKEWDIICTRVKAFVLDPMQYEKDFLSSLQKEKKTKIAEYKLKEKILGELDSIELDEVKLADSIMIYREMPIQIYTYLNEGYISLQEVSALGLQREVIEGATYLRKIGEPIQAIREKANDKQKASFNKQETYIGNLRTYSLTTKSDVLIPIEALKVYYDIIEEDRGIILIDKPEDTTKYLNVNKNFITNNTGEVLQVQITNLYWNGHEILEEKWDINQMEPGEIYPNYNKVYTLSNSKVYLTTIVSKIKIGNEVIWNTSENYGQANKGLFSRYTTQIQKREAAKEQAEREAAKELFPASIIIGTIKYDVGPFKKGDQVEIYRADDGIRYYLHYGKDIIKVPWNSVRVPANPKVENKQATIQEIEDHINSTGITSATNFLVWTDLHRQKTYVFQKQKGGWRIFRGKLTKNDKVARPAILTCSTGHNITPTPRGVFKLRAYVPYFGVNKGYRCKTAVQIFDDYLYHSLIFDKTGSYLLEGKGVLGQRASQGCIRFSPEESEWFYNTMPLQTTVWIN